MLKVFVVLSINLVRVGLYLKGDERWLMSTPSNGGF